MEKSILELKNLRDMLSVEREYERREFDDTDKNVPLGRLVKRGAAWWPLRIGRTYYNSLNQYVVDVYRTADLDVEPVFECGKVVKFFEKGLSGPKRQMSFVANVVFVDGDRLSVALPSADCANGLMRATGLGVQLSLDETSYRLMFEALDSVISSEAGRLSELRRILHGQKECGWASVGRSTFPWLNKSQEDAVNKVVAAKDVAVVHGPPGTGKTTTLVEAVCETLRRESQVLVCAQSNMAVDWVCELLVNCGVGVLRVGNPNRVTDAMLEHTYERRFAAHPDYEQLWAIRKTLRQLRKNKGRDGKTQQKISHLSDRAVELEIKINAELLDGTRVVASTLTGSACRVLSGREFSTLFIDEAAQAMEPACWIAIRKARRVIFVGDHLQLPPTVKSPDAMRGGLGKSLMETVVECQHNAVSLLSVQYRMNEQIMRFSSDWFYGGKLTSAPEVELRSSFLDFDSSIEWVEVDESVAEDYVEELVGQTYGRVNKAEARMIVAHLKKMIDGVGGARFLEEKIDVGIISPYRAQVQILRSMINSNPFFLPFRTLLTVNTIDGFQGQERDVIVLSMVRSNQNGDIGFLKDLRRMNVAMTRARHKLVIVGNSETLCRHSFYRHLIEYISSQMNNNRDV